jgi:hypothetical protein
MKKLYCKVTIYKHCLRTVGSIEIFLASFFLDWLWMHGFICTWFRIKLWLNLTTTTQESCVNPFLWSRSIYTLYVIWHCFTLITAWNITTNLWQYDCFKLKVKQCCINDLAFCKKQKLPNPLYAARESPSFYHLRSPEPPTRIKPGTSDVTTHFVHFTTTTVKSPLALSRSWPA